jgi:ssDNA thymidine ADP-ribosyltransferase, DarT
MTPPPSSPKLYHIVHVDRLSSIVGDGKLLCDAVMASREGTGTTIGMSRIKRRRLALPIESHTGLKVGECVPFYYCPRSVMLFLLHRGNDPDITYRGGQTPIVHLELDLGRVVEWAESSNLRWAITLSNAGAFDFEDRHRLDDLDEIDWNAIRARDWKDPDVKHRKQAEFLVERECPWELVDRVGVHTNAIGQRALKAMSGATHQPRVEKRVDWYY